MSEIKTGEFYKAKTCSIYYLIINGTPTVYEDIPDDVPRIRMYRYEGSFVEVEHFTPEFFTNNCIKYKVKKHKSA